MDPNANLDEQLDIAHRIVEGEYANLRELEAQADRLAELALALDEWIRKGGFVPLRWASTK